MFHSEFFAQTAWIPTGSIQVGVNYVDYQKTVGYDKQRGNYITFDTGRYNDEYKFWNLSGGSTILVSSGRISDSIFATVTFGSGWGTRYTSIGFILDSVNGRIKNFTLRSQNDHSDSLVINYDTVRSESFIKFSEIPFAWSGDTMMVIDLRGGQCKQSILDFNDTTSHVHLWDYHTYWYIQTLQVHSINLSSDSSNFSFLVELKKYQTSFVSNHSNTDRTFSVSVLIPESIIHFSFCNTLPQYLLIYDILGREVKRIEIPSGVSEYRLQRDGFVSGYYFARLGSQTAKFVVN